VPRADRAASRPGKLTYNEQREWGQIETKIQDAEARAAELERRMQAPELLSDYKQLQEASQQLDAVHAEVAALYERWAELEAKREATS
jgi:ATP-binding cassette subfamily F protein uup